MTTFFTNIFTTAMANATPFLGEAGATSTLRVTLFRQAPLFYPNDTRYANAATVTDLVALPGWYPVWTSDDLAASTVTTGTTLSMQVNALVPFTELPGPTETAAIGVTYVGTIAGVVDPLIMVTNTPVFGGRTIKPNDFLNVLTGLRFFSWTYPSGPLPLQLYEGEASLLLGIPPFEVAHTQHVWMFPQRANMIANPSFEKDTSFWSSNGVVTRLQVTSTNGNWAGRFVGTAPLVAESNVFPTTDNDQWTIQCLVRGSGRVKIGLVFWDAEYMSTWVDWGAETWDLSAEFTPLAAIRSAPQSAYACIRVEANDGTFFELDNVLAEKGALKDWPYFDGDTNYGARDDFSWYGGTSRRGASYSLWYNNRRAIVGRLFANDIDPNLLTTSALLADQGMIFDWVPAGTTIVPHMDVLYAGDIQAAPLPKTSWSEPERFLQQKDGSFILQPDGSKIIVSLAHLSDVIPYQNGSDDIFGVSNPWV